MTSKRAASSGPGFLDTVVLIAMAITAAAVAAGLIVQTGIATIPAIIAATALYMVMAASYLTLGRGSGRAAEGGTERLHEIEQALEVIDGDLQRIDRVEDELGRVGLLSERVDQLDRALSERPPLGAVQESAQPQQLTADLEDVHTKIESLRADLQSETRSQREKISRDLRQLESLIVKLAGELTARAAPIPAPAAASAAPAAAQSRSPAPFAAEVKAALEESLEEPKPAPKISAAEPLELSEPSPPPKLAVALKEEDFAADFSYDEIAGVGSAASETPKVEPVEVAEEALELAEDAADSDAEEIDLVAEVTEATVADTPAEEAAAVTAATAEPGMRETLRQAIEGSRIDLYLQPTVTLPERKLRYYEGYTRIRNAADELVLPGAYIPVAEDAGVVPLIDNVLLVKSVQVLRRLKPQSRLKGIFCNISMKSLLDPDYFPELVEFMEENAGLSESLVFEVSQKAMDGLSRGELAALDTLGALGYGFSLDHVEDLDVDFATLRERHFRFVKIAAPLFLDDIEARGAVLPASEMKAYVEDFDLKLIVEKVEDEGSVARLLDYGIDLAQGRLFGEPKLMSPATVRELEDADAA